MIKYILFVLAGLTGGILGGMGMGGGTLLIPLLTLGLNVPQVLAQYINLLAFLPMAVVVICLQAKKKNIIFKEILWIVLPALAASIASAYCVKYVTSQQLGKYFGIFLIVIAIVMLTSQIISLIVKNMKDKQKH